MMCGFNVSVGTFHMFYIHVVGCVVENISVTIINNSFSPAHPLPVVLTALSCLKDSLSRTVKQRCTAPVHHFSDWKCEKDLKTRVVHNTTRK